MFGGKFPLPSHAGMEVPYWLYPEWIAAKVMDFHARNTERFEIAQAQAKIKNNDINTQTAQSHKVRIQMQTQRHLRQPIPNNHCAKQA